MSRLSQLGQCNFPPKKSISELQPDTPYPIKCAKRLKTCSWPSVLLELEAGFVIYLPRRIAEDITDEEIIELSKMSIIYKGAKDIDECPSERLLSSEENKCEKNFIKYTTRDEHGHYTVALPFNEKKELLENNLPETLNRFQSLERRLSRDSVLKEEYKRFMVEYEKLGHMKRVANLNNENLKKLEYEHYIPHHPVFKASSSTTKVRVVFNASSKANGKFSLNDTLLVGPVIQNELFSIILRFRKHNIALVADIEKMFRQVNVREEHTNFQSIPWRNEPIEKIGVYNLCTVTYGTASATFLTTRCLADVAILNVKDYSIASKAIIYDMYVDDLITGCHSVEDGLKLRENIYKILRSGDFYLRKWGSSSVEILEKCAGLNPNDKSLVKDEIDNGILCVIWYSSYDTKRFVINTDIKPSKQLTKRSILSSVSRIFDPLGLIAPITIQSKIFIQQLWTMKLDWDDDLPEFVIESWNRFEAQLLSITEIRSPRRVFTNKIIHRVKNDLDYNISKVFYFTESTIVLNWLNSSPTRWKIFVANRVAKIQALSIIDDWYHVTGKENPADIPTHELRVLGPLTTDEINNSFIRIVILTQREFTSDIDHLKAKGDLATTSKLKSLSPFIDSNNILRVGGRLKNANISYNFKHPILLPKNCALTKLIVWHEHNRHFHAGTSATLAAI
ncbi:uncharacterized protein [Onthophagus taurus]|uniref:uncharacterized protein n=1 Tax=Onthophagus taurus TaxID=166361 RepID=UPI0039BE4E51